MATISGYGRWASPLAAGDVARAKVSLSELCSDGDALYWLESRPAEDGRVVIVRAGAEGLTDHSPDGVSIRSRVHEYGGGAVCLVPGRRRARSPTSSRPTNGCGSATDLPDGPRRSP